MSSKAKLNRVVFKVPRSLDFFTEGGLTSQIGYGRDWWGIVVLKELVDNALDGCESVDIAPKIKIVLEADSLTVSDNGPGLPESTIAASLDYGLRVSDKIAYCSPSRGQLGNALKCLWAVPYVCSDDQHGVVEVDSRGLHFKVEIKGSNNDPQIVPLTPRKGFVKKGTIVKVTWPGIATCQTTPKSRVFTKWSSSLHCSTHTLHFLFRHLAKTR
jgi:DNA topoisomerase VI subunit B